MEKPTASPQISSLKDRWELNITQQEKKILINELALEFNPHPTMWEVVLFRALDMQLIPKCILELVENSWCKITKFVAIKTREWVPVHQHTSNNEMYFFWSNVNVNLYDGIKRYIWTVDISNWYATVKLWWWHGVDNPNKNDILFFAITFE